MWEFVGMAAQLALQAQLQRSRRKHSSTLTNKHQQEVEAEQREGRGLLTASQMVQETKVCGAGGSSESEGGWDVACK